MRRGPGRRWPPPRPPPVGFRASSRPHRARRGERAGAASLRVWPRPWSRRPRPGLHSLAPPRWPMAHLPRREGFPARPSRRRAAAGGRGARGECRRSSPCARFPRPPLDCLSVPRRRMVRSWPVAPFLPRFVRSACVPSSNCDLERRSVRIIQLFVRCKVQIIRRRLVRDRKSSNGNAFRSARRWSGVHRADAAGGTRPLAARPSVDSEPRRRVSFRLWPP